MWTGLYKTVTEYLENITLQDLLDKANTTAGNDYVI
jgi:DNA-binding IscR family transcriptional regulator